MNVCIDRYGCRHIYIYICILDIDIDMQTNFLAIAACPLGVVNILLPATSEDSASEPTGKGKGHQCSPVTVELNAYC